MNGQDQKVRHGQLRALRTEMADALDAIAARLVLIDSDTIVRDSRLDDLKISLDDLARSHAKRLGHLRDDCDGVIARRDALDRHVWNFVEMGFWARLAWVLFGRVPCPKGGDQ